MRPIIIESEVLLASTPDFVEKIDLLRAEIKTCEFASKAFDSIESTNFWVERNIVLAIGIQYRVQERVLIIMENDMQTYRIITFLSAKQFLPLKDVFTISKSHIVFFNEVGIVSCQLDGDNIQSEGDLLCDKEQVIYFRNQISQGALKYHKEEGLITIFSEQTNQLEIIDCSQGLNHLVYVTNFSGVINFNIRDRIMFLNTGSSQIRVVNFKPDSNEVDLNTSFYSIQFTQSFEATNVGFFFEQSRLIMFNQFEIYSLSLVRKPLQDGSGLEETLGQSAYRTLSDNKKIDIFETTKCASHYNLKVLVDVVREENLNKQGQGYIILVYSYSVIFKSQFAHRGESSFSLEVDRSNGRILKFTYIPKYRLAIIHQNRFFTLVDINTKSVIWTFPDYQQGVTCSEIEFNSQESFVVLCSDYGIFVYSTLSAKRIPLAQLPPSFQKNMNMVNYIFVLDSFGNVMKYNPFGEQIFSALAYVSDVYHEDIFMGESIQIVVSQGFLRIFDLMSQSIVYEKILASYEKVHTRDFFEYNGTINAIFCGTDNTFSWIQWKLNGELVGQTNFFCPAPQSLMNFIGYFSDGQLVVVKSASESILCVLSLEQGTMQYLENQVNFIAIMTTKFKDLEGTESFLFVVTKKEFSSVYICILDDTKGGTQTSSSIVPRKLVKYIHLQVECASVRQYDEENIICTRPQETNSDVVFFPLSIRSDISITKTQFDIVNVQVFGNYFILQGARQLVVMVKEQTIFSYSKTAQEVNNANISQLYFQESSTELIIIWSSSLIEHFNLNATPQLRCSLQDVHYFLNYYPANNLLFYISQQYIGTHPLQFLNCYNISTSKKVYSYSYDEDATAYQSALANEYIFLLSNGRLYKIYIKTGSSVSTTLNHITGLDIKQLIVSEDSKQLIILPYILNKAFILDSDSLQMILNPILPYGNTQSGQNVADLYSIVKIELKKNYIILDIPFIQNIVVLSLKDLSLIYLIRLPQAYQIKDIDTESQLLCVLSSNNYLLVYYYNTPTSAPQTSEKSSGNAISEVNLAEFMEPSTLYKGTSFMKTVAAKMFNKFGVLVTSINSMIRVHSLYDGSLRLLINTIAPAHTLRLILYANNFLIAYCKTSVHVLAFDTSLFESQSVKYMPLKQKFYSIPLSNEFMLSDIEVEQMKILFPNSPLLDSFMNSSDRASSSDASGLSLNYVFSEQSETQQVGLPIDISNYEPSETLDKMGDKNYHRMYYISDSKMLYAMQNNQIFKQVQLNNDKTSHTIEKSFFVSASFVTIVRHDSVMIYSQNMDTLRIIDIPVADDYIERVLSEPIELEAEMFIYQSCSGVLSYFSLFDGKSYQITRLPSSKGKLLFFFHLDFQESNTTSIHVFVFGFDDSSFLTVRSDTFEATWTEPNPTQQASFDVLKRMIKFFASENKFFIKTNLLTLVKINYSFVLTADGLGLHLLLGEVRIIPTLSRIQQFFMDMKRLRIIVFEIDTPFIKYMGEDEIPYTSSVLKPNFQQTTLLIHYDLDLYIFYGDMHILIFHAQEMKLRESISDQHIFGNILSVYPLTREILIIATTSSIYTLVFYSPEGDNPSQYFLPSEIPIDHPTILFYRFLTPPLQQDVIMIFLEGVSNEGFFYLKYPLNILSSKEIIPCSVTYEFSKNIISSHIFQNQLNSITQINQTSRQIYKIEIIRISDIDGFDSQQKFLGNRTSKYFRLEAISQNLQYAIVPDRTYTKTTGENFHIKNYQIVFKRFENDEWYVILNKIFGGYYFFILEDIIILGDTKGYRFTLTNSSYISIVHSQFISLHIDIDSVALQYQKIDSGQNDISFEQQHLEALLKVAEQSFFAFLQIPIRCIFKTIVIDGITLLGFQSMFAFILVEELIFENVSISNLNAPAKQYAESYVITFNKISVLNIFDLKITDITLDNVTLLDFSDIESLTITNLVIDNITCTPSSSNSPPFLLNFRGIHELRIDSLTITRVTNCFLINVSPYNLVNVSMRNKISLISNLLINSFTLSNMLSGTSTDQLPTKIYTPPLINFESSSIFLKNFSARDFNILYTTFMNINAGNIDLEDISFSHISLEIPSYLTYPSDSVTIRCNNFISTNWNVLNNHLLNINIQANIQATISNLNVFQNVNIIQNYKNDVFGLIKLESIPYLLIDGSNFESNFASESGSGPLQIYQVINFVLQNSQFISNLSEKEAGGALSLFYTSHAANLINECVFRNNSAPFHSGGAIYSVNSDFTLSNNRFLNNTSQIGGAIRMISNLFYVYFYKSYHQLNNVYDSNSARIYGQSVALYPSKLVAVSNSSDDSLTGDRLEYTFIDSFRSGSTLSIKLKVLDNEDNQIIFDQDTVARHKEILSEMGQFQFTQKTLDQTEIFVSFGSMILNEKTNLIDVQLTIYITPSQTRSFLIQLVKEIQQANSQGSSFEKKVNLFLRVFQSKQILFYIII